MENSEIISKNLDAFCQKHLQLQATNKNPVIISPIQCVEKNGFNYIYFESTGEGAPSYCKRYHQIVVGEYLIDVYYTNSNVIDITASYSIEELQAKFKHYLLYLLDKVGND